MKNIIICIIIFIFSPSVFADTKIDKGLLQSFADQYLKQHQVDEHISAVSITMQTHNKKPVTVYAGNISRDNQTPVTKNNLFHFGSITKSFVSAILLQLENIPELNFSINDNIGKYFPEYTKWHDITVKQLMNMTSGIPDYLSSQKFINDLIENSWQHRKPEELINYSLEMDLSAKPGTQYEYSNTNYILLGMLIEKLTGNSLEQELKSRFFDFYKLNDTWYFTDKINDDVYPKIVRSYIYKKITSDFIPMGKDTTDFTMTFYGAAGGIISTTPDITRWIKILFTPGKILDEKQLEKLTHIISTNNAKEIESPTPEHPTGYGLGIIQTYIPELNDKVYGYEGITLAGRAAYLYSPVHDIVITVAINSSVDGSEENQDHLTDLILKIYSGSIS